MSEMRVIAKVVAPGKAEQELGILPALANRHGLIAGATGTGKTVTLQKMAEQFSRIGVPVFLADVKGDLSGIGAPGEESEKLKARLDMLGVHDWQPQGCSIIPWDLYGEKGHPIRATVADLGPLLFSRLLDLNDIQSGVLQIVFKIAADNQLPLLELKDLRAMVQYVGDGAKQFQTNYGNISTASIGAIQRGLLTLEQQGCELFFGEPMLDINDLMQTDNNGYGMINLLSAEKLIKQPKLYAIFLMWLLTELFARLPEVGDLDKPKLIFFFDEAHLLFTDMPQILLDKIEQVVRLIRSKGVGVYFVTQNPLDVPDSVLGQLGNRVQHALRAFTPRDQKAVKAAAQTMRANTDFDSEVVISELGVGEALVSFLDEKGRPNIVQRAMVIAPESRMGELKPEELNRAINQSPFYGRYEERVERESAFSKLAAQSANTPGEDQQNKNASSSSGVMNGLNDMIFGSTGPRGGRRDGVVQSVAKSMMRDLGRRFIRGILNSILGGRRR